MIFFNPRRGYFIDLIFYLGERFFFKLFLFYFFPLPFIPLIYSTPHSHHTIVHESFFLFAQSLYPLSPPLPCPDLSASSMSLFLLVMYSQTPHMDEIIRYLFFADWLILFLTMFSRSIHTVAEGKVFFLFYGRVAFHCVTVPQFYPLIH